MAEYQYTYGGFTAKFARLNISEDTLYDDAGISQIGVKYTFNINGWLTGGTITDFQAALNNAECNLHTPRLALTIQWSEDGVSDWITLYTFSTTNDIDYGPKPGPFAIQKFDGGKAALYSWSVTATSKLCFDNMCSQFPVPSPVLSITRRFSYSINESGFTRRTVSGKLVVTAQGAPADSFRNQVVPPLPSTFKRETQNFESSENGREMTFTVVDQEQFNTLPIPIAAGRASFTIRTSPGMMCTLTLSGRFEATAANTKSDIYDQICILVAAKVPTTYAGTDFAPIFQSRTITEDVYGNALDFHFEFTQAFGTLDPLAATTSWPFGQTPPNSDGTSQPIGFYGADGKGTGSDVNTPTTPVYDACSSTITSGGGPSGGGPSSGQPSNVPQPTQTPVAGQGQYGGSGGNQAISTTPTVFGSALSSPQHAAAPWIIFKQTVSYEIDPGVVFYPAKVAGIAPLRLQVRNPLMTVIQSGYQCQNALGPTDKNLLPPPMPILGPNSLIHSSVIPDDGEPITGSTYNLYTTHWTYTMVYTKAMPTTTSELQIAYPNDPRPATPNGGIIQNMPELLPQNSSQ